METIKRGRGRPKKVIVHTESAENDLYVITIKYNGKETQATGSSMLEAVKAIKLDDDRFFTKAVLTVIHKDKSYIKMFLPRHLKVLSWGKELNRIVLAKNLSMML